MGRVKSTAVKTLGNDLLEKNGDSFSTSFEENKAALNRIKKIKSKKIRNVVAGHITRKKKKPKPRPPVAEETAEESADVDSDI